MAGRTAEATTVVAEEMVAAVAGTDVGGRKNPEPYGRVSGLD